MAHWTERQSLVAAVYVLFERENEMLFLKRANTGYMDGSYTLPAGYLDGGEAPTTAAAREAMEEVGLRVDPEDLELAHCMVYRAAEGSHERVTLFFRAKLFSGEPRNAEPQKCDDVAWFPKDKPPVKIVWEARHALDQIAAGNVY